MIRCSNNTSPENKSDFLKGKWKFISIETEKIQSLDSISRKIYDEQLQEFISNSFLQIKDSTYKYALGDNDEGGKWKYDPFDSILSLKSEHKVISLFKIKLNKNRLKLVLLNSLSKEYWILEK